MKLTLMRDSTHKGASVIRRAAPRRPTTRRSVPHAAHALNSMGARLTLPHRRGFVRRRAAGAAAQLPQCEASTPPSVVELEGSLWARRHRAAAAPPKARELAPH